MKRLLFLTLVVLVLLCLIGNSSAMTRTLKRDPAVVIVAFGTTTRAQATYDFFEDQLRRELPPEYRKLTLRWAFTSEIVRERANRKFRKLGINKRYQGLLQTLADLEDEGYRKVAIQSLHIFPGQEYEEMVKVIEALRQLGLRIEYGGTLLHEWPRVHEVVGILEKEFLGPEEGCNVIVTHGTPLTFPGSNSTYLGLERYITLNYPNVFVGAVEGVLTREEALKRAKGYGLKRVRMIPFMYVAGDHIMNDIMGTELDEGGSPSWAMEMEAAGFKVDTPYVNYKGERFFRGLGFHPEINRIFIEELVKSLKRLSF